MAIPWLIGGAAVLAATAVTALNKDGAKPTAASRNTGGQKNNSSKEEADLEFRISAWQTYADRVTANLAKKHSISNVDVLRHELEDWTVYGFSRGAAPSSKAKVESVGLLIGSNPVNELFEPSKPKATARSVSKKGSKLTHPNGTQLVVAGRFLTKTETINELKQEVKELRDASRILGKINESFE